MGAQLATHALLPNCTCAWQNSFLHTGVPESAAIMAVIEQQKQ
jgi:hypothetical protein